LKVVPNKKGQFLPVLQPASAFCCANGKYGVWHSVSRHITMLLTCFWCGYLA